MNHVNVVKILFEKFIDLFKYIDGSGNNVFLVACKHSSLDVIKYLLDKFAPQNGVENKLTEQDLRKGIAIIE